MARRMTRDYTSTGSFRDTKEYRKGLRKQQRRKRRKTHGTGPYIAVLLILLIVLLGLLAYAWLFVWSPTPTITLNGDAEMTVACGNEFQDPGAAAQAGDTDLSGDIVTEGSVDTSKVGDYELTYRLNYHFKEYTAKRTVHVKDMTAPVITLTDSGGQITVNSMDEYQEPGYSAADNVDGDVTANVQVSQQQTDELTYVITYTVTDAAGNTGTAQRTVMLTDTTPPVIQILGDQKFRMKRGMTFNDPGVTATDNVDGDITSKVQVDSNVNTNKRGVYKVTYTVTDAAGNTASAVRKVLVYRKSADIQVSEGATGDDGSTADDSGKSIICLTFDDGPSTKVTPQILDVLEKNGINATFFVVRYEDSMIPILQRMVNDGDTIGLHAWNHNYNRAYRTMNSYYKGILKLQAKVKEDTGYESWICRFPGGSSNTVSREYTEGVMTYLAKKLQDNGFSYVDWNVDSTDAEGNGISVEQIVENVTSELKKGRTNVVLCHDTNAKQTTVDALQQIIDYGKQNGYEFQAITKDTATVHHTIAN